MKEITKGMLAKTLSQLKVFENPKIVSEQYTIDGEIAAQMLWNSAIIGDFSGKVIVDLGAGTGILGIGALLLGAKKALFVEKDSYALGICKENYEKIKSEFKIGEADFIEADIANCDVKGDVVIQNPPFGTKKEHADKEFLERAFKTAQIIYSIHKATTRDFIEKFALQNNFKTTHYWEFDLPLKKTYKFHKSKIKKIKIGIFRLEAKFINNQHK